MNRISKTLAICAFSLVILALPSIASAQWYPNNGPYYGGQNRDLRNVARNLKDRSRDFERQVDRSVDNRNDRRDRWGNRGGGYGNNDLKQLAGDFRRAADHFEDKYGNGRNLRNSEDAARRLLDSASRLDRALQDSRVRNLNGQWNSMRRDLNMVAQTYGYNYNNRNRNQRNTGTRFPTGRFPWPF